jgi:hypothetical protein
MSRKVPFRWLMKEQVGSLFGLPGNAYVQVQPPVGIHVGHGYARCPAVGAYPRLVGNVFKPQVAFVEVQAARDHVSGKVQVRQTVVVDVTDRHAATVVDVLKLHGVHRVVGGNGIGERDAAFRRVEQFKKLGLLAVVAAGRQQ